MAWQDVFPLNVSRIDAEEERELRLASQARLGAEWALTALVARYQPPVTRYLTRLTGDPEITRRLAEHIFVRMERRLRGPHGGQNLRLWLLRACTEAGLDTLRRPHRTHTALRLDSPRTAGLLPERAGDVAAEKLRAGWGALANLTGSTSRQVRQLIWSTEAARSQTEPVPPRARTRDTSTANGFQRKGEHRRTLPLTLEDDPAQQDPREALRYRMVRAVLAEIPYGDAQCLALHLIAGLNQAEVAQALGITHSATRHRIVQGLQLFAQRYEAAAASLGLSPEALAPDAPAASMPPVRAATASAAPLAAASTPAASLEDGFVPIEDQPTLAWDAPPFVVVARALSAPGDQVPERSVEAVEAVESPPPAPLPVTIAATQAPEVSADAEAAALTLEEYDGAAHQSEQSTPPHVVETTAVVDALPVDALPEMPVDDTIASIAPDGVEAVAATSLALVAAEIPARPPEQTPHEAVASSPPLSPPARIVPVLTPPAPHPEPLVRIVPVLTSGVLPPANVGATSAFEKPAAVDVPLAPTDSPPVRTVPVLTRVVFAGAETPEADVEQSTDAPDDESYHNAESGWDAPREKVVLATGAPDATTPIEVPS